MVNDEATIQFGQRGYDQWTEGVAEDVNGDHEGAKLQVLGMELLHDFWYAWGEH